MPDNRARILKALRRHREGYISGSTLASELGISRPAVWKQIETLRALGYDVEAKPRLGYKLRSAPDRLLPEELKPRTKVMGKKIVHFNSVPSTNLEAKRLAEEGAEEGTVVVAERQESGRGRLGRGWLSPPGGIYFSLVLRPRLSPAELSLVTLAAAVAVADAVHGVTGLEVKIKWPNDVLLDGKKLVGILTEISAEADSIGFVVLGVGVNANLDEKEFPREVRPSVASLSSALGRPVDRPTLLTTILESFEELYAKLSSGRFEEVLKRWSMLSATLGAEVRITTVTGTYQGKAIGVSEDGALVVRLSDGAHRVFHSGEVQHLRVGRRR